MKTLPVSLLFAAFTVASLAQAPQARPDFQSAVMHQHATPVFPASLLHYRRTSDVARILINVDREGRLADWLVLGYTDELFAQAAVAALKQWTFEPARWHGEPVAVCIPLTFNFERQGTVVSITQTEAMDALLASARHPREVYRPCTLRELDRIPEPLHTVSPAYPQELAARGVSGDVTVEFYIDEHGAVRMPSIIGRPAQPLADLAIAAVSQWRFEPPTSGSRPVLVCVRQLFRFALQEKPAPAS